MTKTRKAGYGDDIKNQFSSAEELDTLKFKETLTKAIAQYRKEGWISSSLIESDSRRKSLESLIEAYEAWRNCPSGDSDEFGTLQRQCEHDTSNFLWNLYLMECQNFGISSHDFYECYKRSKF